jgi:hypothetical protein
MSPAAWRPGANGDVAAPRICGKRAAIRPKGRRIQRRRLQPDKSEFGRGKMLAKNRFGAGA